MINNDLIKKRFKKKFGKKITVTEIKKIWDDFLENITDELIKGGEVRIDKHSTIEVIGSSVWDDKNFAGLLKRGKMLKGGMLTKINLNKRRMNVKYKIVYKNAFGEVYFNAHPKIKKKVREALINTNNYFNVH